MRSTAWTPNASTPMLEALIDFDTKYPHNSTARVSVANLEDVPQHWNLPFHQHDQGQLIFVTSGMVRLETHVGVWVAPSQSGIWVPGRVVHRFRSIGDATGYVVFLQPAIATGMHSVCLAIGVSAFLKALIQRTALLPSKYETGGPEDRITSVLIDELLAAPPGFLDLPLPADPRLRAYCDALLANPCDKKTLSCWAKSIGMSGRNMARLFKAETGLSLDRWRRHSQVVAAATLMTQGRQIKEIAQDLGYESPASFATMFKKEAGMTPRRFASQILAN